ncbi:uncharacterized protein MELLADRAFT_89207 [Melampsora larici-populina 98AG31]|uniref:Uncharacterized protein n=1 Tax=Melampsora larici-populina (strain 98AG31 / pathotype 3-4-7) TaxID=747676 RepID=F4R5B7_MELLP|nr:uncharacterized protein MELLADRAFT_89207 [Melampsora larici-populina 98AG31]EGG12018.1 hypothetical protein MELLADRAFT_89207 [Melampsora larici-populina 98AG31]
MGSYGPHSRSKNHLDAVVRFLARKAAEQVVIPALDDNHPPSTNRSPSPPQQDDIFGHDAPGSDTPEPPPSPLSCLRAFALAQEKQPGDSEDSDDDLDIHKLAEAIHAMEDDMFGPNDEAMDEASLEEDLQTGQVLDSSEWHPFKKKEHPIPVPIPPYTLDFAYMPCPAPRVGGAACSKQAPQEESWSSSV